MWNRVIPAFCVTVLMTASLAAAGTPAESATAGPIEESVPEVEKVTAFAFTFDSHQELFDALEVAIAADDVEVLRALAVCREEFRDLVWPTLAIANNPKSNFTWEFVWRQHELRHESSLRRITTDFGGQGLDIVDVQAHGKTTDHGSFHIHRENYVEVVRPDGSREELRLFGSLLETDDGRYKIYSFIND